MTNEYRVVAFDGGFAGTGVATIAINFRAFSRPENKWEDWVTRWKVTELTGPEHEQYSQAVAIMRRSVDAVGFLSTAVVSEDFDLVQLVGNKENLLSPVRFNAVMAWECKKVGATLRLQGRQMRTNVTPQRLVHFGFNPQPGYPWRKSGKGKDSFAAMQHAVTYIRRLKQESIKRPWKLSEDSRLNAYWDCACATGRKRKCDLVHPH